METKNYDFRTPKQRATQKRTATIISKYTEYRAKAADGVSNNRIIECISSEVGCTAQNVRVTLRKANLIKYRPRK